jgi:hypothetical protein
MTPQFGPLSEFWVHGQYGVQLGSPPSYATFANGLSLVAFDSSDKPRLAIRGTGTDGQIKISTIDSSGTFVDLVTSAAGVLTFIEPNTNPNALDFFINYSTSGQATVYWNGVNICDTGPSVNVTTNSVTALAQVAYCLMYSNANFGYQGWSECIVQDTTTLGMALQTLPPLATGNTQAWTGSVGNIDELVLNLANYNFTVSDNEISQWTVSGSLPTGTWGINAVIQSAALSAGSSGPQHFSWNVRTSAPADFEAGTIALSTGIGFYQFVWNENPSTSAAWTVGQLVDSGIESLA